MKEKVVVIHTLSTMINDFKELFAKLLPEVELVNIVDDSLLTEAVANDTITANAKERYMHYAQAASSLGAAAILNMCSTYSECVDMASKSISTPIFKIDEPMAIEANRLGKKIAVIITAHCTIGPSCRLVERHGNKDSIVTPYFVHGAMDALLSDCDRDKHDRLVITAVEEAAKSNDVIIMAQGSMSRLLPMLGHVGKPVLTSMESGVLQLRSALKLS